MHAPRKRTSGMTRVKAIADVARRRNRSEEIYKAGAQRLVTPATYRADRTAAGSEIELALSTPSSRRRVSAPRYVKLTVWFALVRLALSDRASSRQFAAGFRQFVFELRRKEAIELPCGHRHRDRTMLQAHELRKSYSSREVVAGVRSEEHTS